MSINGKHVLVITYEYKGSQAQRKGTHPSVEDVSTSDDTLISKGFSIDNIVSIASNDGAKQAITTILAKYDTLISKGFSKDNIVLIASNIGAKQAITTILAKYDTLISKEFISLIDVHYSARHVLVFGLQIHTL